MASIYTAAWPSAQRNVTVSKSSCGIAQDRPSPTIDSRNALTAATCSASRRLVFTLPSELRAVVAMNRERMFALMFEGASKTVLTLSRAGAGRGSARAG
jgi:hypothetical protein